MQGILYSSGATAESASRAIGEQMRLEPGQETPPQHEAFDYLVYPRASTKLLRTTYKDGKVLRIDEIEHLPGKPYFVAASEDGIAVSLKNIGDVSALYTQTVLPAPDWSDEAGRPLRTEIPGDTAKAAAALHAAASELAAVAARALTAARARADEIDIALVKLRTAAERLAVG